MRNKKKISQNVRQKNRESFTYSSDKIYGILSVERETDLLFHIAKAMKIALSKEDIRAAVEHFKEKESSG